MSSDNDYNHDHDHNHYSDTGNCSDDDNINLRTFHGVKFVEDIPPDKQNDADADETRSQGSMGSAAARLLTKNHPLLEGLFGAIYVMAKENNLYRFLAGAALFVDFLQILSYLYWPEFHWGVSTFQDALFYSHLDSGSHKVFWFWASLALALFLLLSTVAIQFKRKGAIHSVKLVRILRLVAGATTTILCIPIITALVKPFECMVRGSDADWFPESCYRGEHLAYMMVSILLLLPLAPLILVIAVTYYDPSPTLHHDMLTRSTSRHDAFFIFSKMCMVVSFTLLIDWPAIPVLVLGGTSLCLGWMYYQFPPFHLVLINWAYVGFFLSLAITSLIQLSVVIDGSNGVIYFAVSMVTLLLVFGCGLWLARRKSLPFSNVVQDEIINARKWHRPWDVEMSACFLMPHLYRRVSEDGEDLLGEEEDGEEQRYVFDEGCAERLKALYTRGVRRYPHSTFLRLRFAMFLTSIMKTTDGIRSARGHILRAMKMHRRLDHQFTIYYLRKMWESEQEASGMGESKMDIISSIEMQRNFKMATQSHSRARHHIGTFWQLLLDGDVNPDVLVSVIEKIERYEMMAQRAYARLIDRFPNSVKVLREYGMFCSEVKNDQNGAHQVFALADQLEEEQSRVGGSRRHSKRRSSTHSDTEDERRSVCSADRMSGCESSCIDSAEGGSHTMARSSFIHHSRNQKPPQIKVLNVKLWIVLAMILAVMIATVVMSEMNASFRRNNTDHLSEVILGQGSQQGAAIFIDIIRLGLKALPPIFLPDSPYVVISIAKLAEHLTKFTNYMHSAYHRRFSHYGFNKVKEFWEQDDLCVQVHVGNGQYTEECMNYWEATTRFITYAKQVKDSAEASLLTAEGCDNYGPFRWIMDNAITVIQKHGEKLPSLILEEEDRILSIHFITMLCFTIGSCAVTILAMAFFIRPAVVTIREGRNSTLSLFRDIPRSIIQQRRDFYTNKNSEDQDNHSFESFDNREKKWNSLHVSLVATAVICALIVVSGVVSITLLDGANFPSHRVRWMGERQILGYQMTVESLEVLHNDGVRPMTLQGAIDTMETYTNKFVEVNHALKYGSSEYGISSPPMDDRIAEMMYDKLDDAHPKPMDAYLTGFIDGAQGVVREAKAAYPTQLNFMQSMGFIEIATRAEVVIDGSANFTQEVVDQSKRTTDDAAVTILVVMVLAVVLIAVVYYVVLIQYVVRRLYHESQRTMRMFLLLPEEAIKQSDGLRRFLESNGTDYGNKKGRTNNTTVASDKVEEDAFLREGLLTVDSSGSVMVANEDACHMFGYGGDSRQPWPRLNQLMSAVDLNGPDAVALRTDALVSCGDRSNNGERVSIRVMYDLHHWGDLIVVKVRRCHVKESDEERDDSVEETSPRTSSLRSELVRLSRKPLMLLDADGFPEEAQDALLCLLGYSCVDDVPHIRSLFPDTRLTEECEEEGLLTDVVCGDGARKRVRVEYHRGDDLLGVVTIVSVDCMDFCVRSGALLVDSVSLEGETTEGSKEDIDQDETASKKDETASKKEETEFKKKHEELRVVTPSSLRTKIPAMGIQPLSPKGSPHLSVLPPLTCKEDGGAASAV